MTPQFHLQLYVTGNGPNSALAIANLKAFCLKHLPNQHEIEIVDVLVEPERALAEGVLLTPTLVKLSPCPVCRILGTLSDPQPILLAFGLAP